MHEVCDGVNSKFKPFVSKSFQSKILWHLRNMPCNLCSHHMLENLWAQRNEVNYPISPGIFLQSDHTLAQLC